jgi:fatty-acyl-CoA synthase
LNSDEKKYGEQVCVWIQMHDKSELTALEIKNIVEKIAHYISLSNLSVISNDFVICVPSKIEMRER